MEGEINAKLKSINLSNPIQALRNFLKVRPVNCRDKQLIAKDIQGFQLIMSKISDKDYDKLIQTFSQNQCELILDYLHRFMQHIGDSQANVATGSLLSLYDKIIHLHGPSIILNAISRPDTLTCRLTNNY